MSCKFFVEGTADKKFLSDYIQFVFQKDISEQIVFVNGKDSLHLVKNQFEINSIKGGINLVIFDADSNYEQSLKTIREKVSELNIELQDIFLFPNNSSKGSLEDLLLKITPSEHNDFFDCFNNYENCLKGHKKFYNPALKTKVYAYVDTLNLARKPDDLAKENKRNYADPYYWDLNSEYLNSLKVFLAKYLLP
ncbi:MAG: DUF3226 domain-containing protein [Bacteroidia bacterium]